jgi:hypothetical protein
VKATFADHGAVRLPRAEHDIQEDAPDEIADRPSHRFCD